MPLLAMVVLVACAADAVAQQPGQKLSKRELARRGRTIQTWMKAPLTGANLATTDQYFKEYYFPSMTQTDQQSLEKLGDMRADLFNRFIWPAHPSVQKHMTAESLKFVRAVLLNRPYPAPVAGRPATVRYAPPVKYNAALILGLLDDKYATRNDPALRPSATANNLLSVIVQRSVDAQTFPNHLQVAALVGLERHTQHFAGLAGSSKAKTAKALLAAINQQEYPSGTSKEVQYWMKLQAARAIANMNAVGKNGLFVAAIGKLVSDPDADLYTRSCSAELLQKITLTGLPASVGNQLVGAVKGLACDVTTTEQSAAEKFRDALQNPRLGQPEMQKLSRFRFNEQGAWEYERRGLIADLDRLRLGLEGVKSVAGAEQAAVESMRKAVRDVISVAGDKNTDFALMESLTALSSEVQRVAGCKPKPEAGADEEPEADLLGGS